MGTPPLTKEQEIQLIEQANAIVDLTPPQDVNGWKVGFNENGYYVIRPDGFYVLYVTGETIVSHVS